MKQHILIFEKLLYLITTILHKVNQTFTYLYRSKRIAEAYIDYLQEFTLSP